MIKIEHKNKSKFKRKLSAIERMHFRQPNPNVVMVANVSGVFNENDFSRIFSRLTHKHPLLKSRIELTKDDNAYFVTNDVPEIERFIIISQKKEKWTEIVEQEIRNGFNCELGPLIRFNIVIQNGMFDLIITAHHSICDALSLVYLFDDILKHFNNQSLNPQESVIPPPLDEETIPISISGNLLQRLPIKLLNKILTKNKNAYTQDDFEEIYKKFWKNKKNSIATWTYDQIFTDIIIRKSKEKNISVNDILVTSLLLAQERVQKDKSHLKKFIVSVDFRNKLNVPAGKALGKFASGIRLDLEYNEGHNFWDNCQRIHHRIQKDLTNQNIFASQRLNSFDPKIIDSFHFVKYGEESSKIIEKLLENANIDKLSFGFLLTNLGDLDLATRYGDYSLNSIYGPFVFSDTIEKYIGVMTVNSKLHFSLSYDPEILPKEVVLEFKEEFNSILNDITHEE